MVAKVIAWLKHLWTHPRPCRRPDCWCRLDERAARYGVDPEFLAAVERSVHHNWRALTELARRDEEEE